MSSELFWVVLVLKEGGALRVLCIFCSVELPVFLFLGNQRTLPISPDTGLLPELGFAAA